jgi:hypothetical protein
LHDEGPAHADAPGLRLCLTIVFCAIFPGLLCANCVHEVCAGIQGAFP